MTAFSLLSLASRDGHHGRQLTDCTVAAEIDYIFRSRAVSRVTARSKRGNTDRSQEEEEARDKWGIGRYRQSASDWLLAQQELSV